MLFSDVVKENIGAWTSWSMELREAMNLDPNKECSPFPLYGTLAIVVQFDFRMATEN